MTEGTTVVVQRCLDRLRAGDETGRAELLNAASERLARLARKMFRAEARLRRWEDTADVLQAAMLRLLRRLRNVTPISPRDFFRLAAGEIRRELIDLARRYFGPWGHGANHEPNSGARVEEDSPDAEQCPSELAEWGEFHERVGTLPDVEQEAFDLVWYQGLSHVEAAKILGVSARTIKRRWQAACLKLENTLGGRLPPG